VSRLPDRRAISTSTPRRATHRARRACAAVLVAALVVWCAPQTWDFTEKLTAPKAVFCVLALAVSLVVMDSQGYNPFIYFIF